MKKMLKGLDLFIVTSVVCMVICTAMIITPKANNEVENIITDQEIAEFAVEHDHSYDGVVDVEIYNVGYNDSWGCDVIDCRVYVDGDLKAFRGINRDVYLNMLERSRKDS